ncbi:hypothetical protein [uncultured Tateyamaria sp.]|uniref:hypothetical protein n=1 Tax=uncultured Tateyamaria sp. TaxID=455651 RepID=UPI0026292742|nr:hypothetical protein [uncultured Tateyamaria sp.]
MSHDAKQIEKANADAHREGLADALSALLSTRLPDHLGRAATGQLSDTARMVVDKGMSGVRANPAGVALIGTGLAMLFMARNQPQSQTEARPTAATPLSGEADERIAKADERIKQQARIQADKVDVGPGRAQALRMKLDAGLDKLGPDARARVRAARLKAVSAQEGLERHAARWTETARATHEDRPWMTVLAMAGIGAVVGALLPGTRRESELMGAKRDQLMREAERALRDEISALETRGKAAVNQGMSAVRDELDAAVNTDGARATG